MIRSRRNDEARAAMTRTAAFVRAAVMIAAMAAIIAGCASKKTEPLPGVSENAKAETSAPERATSAGVPTLVNTDARTISTQKPTYPFDTCVVCGMELTAHDTPKDVLENGRLVRFCSDACASKFAQDPAPSLAKIDAAIVTAQLATYPLDVCVIEGGKLGAMGEPAKHIYGTRLVQFCCPDCEPTFAKDPAAAMAKIDAAMIAAQLPSYASHECPLMEGMALDALGEPFDFLYGTRLVRLCCEQCVDKFWQNPEAAIAKLDALAGSKTGTGT